jgi:hypothetical protein
MVDVVRGYARAHTDEGESMRITSSLVLTCGLAWAAPAFAEEGRAAFQYSPHARLVQGGQFRAEVWRRDVATGSSDVAWSDAELSPTAAKAMAEACATLQKDFDPGSACSVHQGSAPEAAKPKVVTKALVGAPPAHAGPPSAYAGPPSAYAGPPPAHKGVLAHPPRVEAQPAVTPEKSTWANDFWKTQDKFYSGGGGAGGGGGGGD